MSYHVTRESPENGQKTEQNSASREQVPEQVSRRVSDRTSHSGACVYGLLERYARADEMQQLADDLRDVRKLAAGFRMEGAYVAGYSDALVSVIDRIGDRTDRLNRWWER